MRLNLIATLLIFTPSISEDTAPKNNIEITQFQDIEPVFALGKLRSVGTWDLPPDIILCDHPEITLTDVRRAAEWWVALGYEFNLIQERPLHPVCIGARQWSYFTIIISMPTTGYRFVNYGVTTIRHKNMSILGANIEISEPKPRVLEHEIGHALGWLHWSRTRHMMHPQWVNGGWGTKSLNSNQSD